jgi:hypothetical protein
MQIEQIKLACNSLKRTLELPPNRYTLRMAITKER